MSDHPPTAIVGASAFRGLIGVAREDITPPVGIYARCWGAATHDVAEGIHRPLTLTCVTLDPIDGGPGLVLMSADLMSWRSREDERAVRQPVLDAMGDGAEARLMFCLAHTHSAPSVRSEDAGRPGWHLIAAYQQKLREAAVRAYRRAIDAREPARLEWRYGRCDLAANRDLVVGGRVVCGYNPGIRADDTLLVGRVTAERDGRVMAVVVNYACHPTTLGWQNRLISPDYVGSLREVVERETGGLCLFLQGASGELAPAEQYVGDVAVAERHGRRVGFATLATLEGMAGLAYEGVVESGAPLAVWKRREAEVDTTFAARMGAIRLALKPMPSAAELEEQWRRCEDPVERERLWRRRGVRRVVGDGTETEVPYWVWRVGDAVLVGHPNEAYSVLQMELRARLGPRVVAVMNLVNGSAGYLPPRAAYASGGYQVVQTPFAAGALEALVEGAKETAASLCACGS